jgi:hypothetical protein
MFGLEAQKDTVLLQMKIIGTHPLYERFIKNCQG